MNRFKIISRFLVFTSVLTATQNGFAADNKLSVLLSYQQRAVLATTEQIDPTYQIELRRNFDQNLSYGVIATGTPDNVAGDSGNDHYQVSNYWYAGPQIAYTYSHNKFISTTLSAAVVTIHGIYDYRHIGDVITLDGKTNDLLLRKSGWFWGANIEVQSYIHVYDSVLIGAHFGLTPSNFSNEQGIALGLGYAGAIVGVQW